MTNGSSQMKSAQVQEIFSSIAPSYDLLNSVLSLGLHKRWKRRAVKEARLREGDSALDLCTGTGDIALYLTKKVGPRGKIVALDFSEEMLVLARLKAQKAKVNQIIDFQLGDAMNLNLPNDSFHAVTIGFGIRNVDNIKRTFAEIHRVLKPGGRIVCLEFSHAESSIIGGLYSLYTFRVIPLVGGIISGNFDAYYYLPTSIKEFPDQNRLKSIMEKAGFKDTRFSNLTFGIVTLHVGEKP